MNAQLISGPWRSQFEELVRSTTTSLIIAAPFIKLEEARWVANLIAQPQPRPSFRLRVLTNLRADSIMASSLDIEALHLLSTRTNHSEVISVPRLHAKVYVSDDRAAVVTSANLTRAGLDTNVEYGVRLQERSLVQTILNDVDQLARLGSQVPTAVLAQLVPVEQELRHNFGELMRSARADVRRTFDRRYRSATEALIATQVGTRSANAVFSEAILYVLSRQAATTAELHPKIQRLLPELCDDKVELVINGERYGKRWKHQVRNSQQALKRAGMITFDGRRWSRTGMA